MPQDGLPGRSFFLSPSLLHCGESTPTLREPRKIAVASVNGVDVDETVYQQALSEQRRSLVQMMGRNVDAEFFASSPFKLEVLDSLIDTQLQAEYLADRGYRITNEQLSERIGAFPAFQSEGPV